MLDSILFPDSSNLCIDSVSVESQVIVIVVSSTSTFGVCPHCSRRSERVHSFYVRHPADLPLAACTVRLKITVQRFFCDDTDCPCVTFAQRIPAVLKPYARHTNRLIVYLRQIAFALGGEAGARFLRKRGVPVSPDTLLRIIRNSKEPEVKTPRVLGVDDWAFRKGHSYGTILVDLEKRRPVDLLPDRKADSLETWLREHPGVEIISRDRGNTYIKGATSGAPDAIQVADRWHLLKNLRENLEKWLETKPACLKAAADKSKQDSSEQEKLPSTHSNQVEKTPSSTTTEQTPEASFKLTNAEKHKLAIRAKRQGRYETVKELHEQGFSNTEIARQLNIDRKTVRKYIKAESCPMYPEGRRRASKLDSYKEYITKRFNEGCTNATKILAEIRQLGYSGSRTVMMEWVQKALRSLHSKATNSSQKKVHQKTVAPWTARRASWLLMKGSEELSHDDQQALERMKQASGKVDLAYSLSQRFVRMIKEGSSCSLLPWLEEAKKSGIDALKQFAKGIKQDIDAVTNALRYEWSQGQVEGQVNRLKLIKRQMYGRANFDLLRKRVLFHPI